MRTDSIFKAVLLAALLAFSLVGQELEPTGDKPAPRLTIPEGVVPTPAQTNNPKLIGIGMLVVGIGMGLFLFARGDKSEKNDGDDNA